jgi:hypothetical protein
MATNVESNHPMDGSEHHDIDVCLYYLRALSNIFRWAPDAIWATLASTAVTDTSIDAGGSETSKQPAIGCP